MTITTNSAEGINATFMPDAAFPFQQHLIEWALNKGNAALFEDCGLGKTIQQLTFAENVIRHTNKPALILTPLAVGAQTVAEAAKFGMDAVRCGDGKVSGGARIIVANYERLHHFDPADFSAIICDESGILKNHSGATRNAVIAFTKSIRYRLLCTATPAPNDVMELGNSVEALGIMRRVDMLARYFIHDSADTGEWRLKGHAEYAFWRFVASWARAVRHPRDIGFDQPGYDLPKMTMTMNALPSKALDGFLIPMTARTLQEQRNELRSTINERCAKVADIANSEQSQFVAWCSLNDESRLMTQMIDGAVELSGSDDDEEKEEKIMAFSAGQIRAIVTKPKICSHGVNWQCCNRTSFFPSHSHEQFYQAVRRFWRFRQERDVKVSIVTTESESAVLDNLLRKERESSEMFTKIVSNMSSHYVAESTSYQPTNTLTLPSWLR
jgi:superfamily II DNA or RNA helicase